MRTSSLARAVISAPVALLFALGCAAAPASGLEAGVEWRLSQPDAPPAPPGVEQLSGPVPLGQIGDISFYAPNRGALITAGAPPTVPPGVWEYDGTGWHELSEVCGATDGRIVWSGPEEFWTISDGRPGQALVEGKRPPLEDNTLCRFSNPNHAGEPLRVMDSFAFPAFQANSYQPMHAAACFGPSDCWFAGDALPAEAIDAGAFHLHWDGRSLTEQPYPAEGHAIESMVDFEGRLFEGVRLREGDRDEVKEPRPPAIHAIDPAGVEAVFEGLPELPLYELGELPEALDALQLSAGEEFLWAAAGPQQKPPAPGQVTILRGTNLTTGRGSWTQVVGPLAPVNNAAFGEMTVTSIAAEPGSESAWVGLDTVDDAGAPARTAPTVIARVSAQPGEAVESEQTLPGVRGGAWRLTCPAVHDCWLATSAGWLYHLSSEQEQTLEQDPNPAFQTLITERPIDQGLPQIPPDTLPPDNSGLPEGPPEEQGVKPTEERAETRVTVALISHVHSRLIHGTTLELSFHLAVKARLRLLAKRAKHVVAKTPMLTMRAGNRKLDLRLNVKRWPTKLDMQSHPLAPLPTVPAGQGGVGGGNTVSTSMAFPNRTAANAFGLFP